jgi:peptidoglycan/LPS O-acetylase OafA/YrhL
MSALRVAGAISKPFRPEIEGLRAAAVAAVVLFHSGFQVVSGGFLGVDVFFVISGFLITRNIIFEVEGAEFRLSYFYWRRILRLFPASATTVLVTLIAGFVLLPPDEVKQLAHSAIAVIFAVSNIYFWMHVGYFDTDAHLKPLLHTWSLGVEEQFYLVWAPSLAAGLPFIRRRGMLWLILAAAAASLTAATIVLDHDPSAAFYLAPFRIFEFAAGIGLALVDPECPRNSALRTAIFLAGLVAVLCSFLLLDSSVSIPGPLALLPCLGTAAVIYAGAEHPAGMVLTNPIARFVGRISYSLYLTHWPVAVFIGTETVWQKLTVLMLSFLTAGAQFYLVEDPMRRAGKGLGRTRPLSAYAVCLALALCIGSGAALASATQGLKFRLPIALRDMPSDQQLWEERNVTVRVGKCFLVPDQKFSDFDQRACTSIDPGKPNILVIGDSFASDLYSAVRQAYPDIHFLQATSGNCIPILNTPSDKNCRDMLNFVFADFLQNYRLDGVILEAGWGYGEAGWGYSSDEIDATLEFLKPLAGRVYLAGPPVAFQKDISNLIFESRSIDIESATRYVFAHRRPGTGVNDAMIQRFAGRVSFINLHSIMCTYKCRLFDPEGRRIFLDFGHLTKAGATYLANMLKSQHPRLLGRVGAKSASSEGTPEPSH